MDNKYKELEKKAKKAEKKQYWGKFDNAFDDLMEFHENKKQIEEEVRNKVISQYKFCIDCGAPLISVFGQSMNAVKRCPDCQEIYRRKYKAEKEGERRKRKKANTN